MRALTRLHKCALHIFFIVAVLPTTSYASCTALLQYMDAAKGNFVAIRGRVNDSGDWVPSVFLPEANKCKLMETGDDRVTASCTYLFVDEADRSVGLQQVQAAVESCLGWPTGGLRNSRNLSYRGSTGYRVFVRPFDKYDGLVEITFEGK
jgi:hypothetical protein